MFLDILCNTNFLKKTSPISFIGYESVLLRPLFLRHSLIEYSLLVVFSKRSRKMKLNLNVNNGITYTTWMFEQSKNEIHFIKPKPSLSDQDRVVDRVYLSPTQNHWVTGGNNSASVSAQYRSNELCFKSFLKINKWTKSNLSVHKILK